MARLFDDAASDKLVIEADVLSGFSYPFTMACWFRSDSIALNQVLMCITDNASNNNLHYIQAAGAAAGDPVRVTTAATASASASTSTGYSANVWHHACGVWASATSRTVYLDAGGKVTETTNLTPVGLDRTTLGVRGSSTAALFMSGEIQEAAIWFAALDDAQVALLASGMQPPMVRSGLAAYWPLYGDSSPEPDVLGGNNLTLTGTVKATHRWMIGPPGSPLWIRQPSGLAHVRL